MKHWLIKTDPETWSWDDQVKKGTTKWDGVRNYAAAASLKAMKKGDHAFFYHSGEERAIVGIVEITREYYPDPADATKRFGMIDVRLVGPLARPVTLDQIKAEPRLGHLALVRQSRLSVMPIDEPSWTRIYAMGGGEKRAKKG